MKHYWGIKVLIWASLMLFFLSGCQKTSSTTHLIPVSIRLEWIPQAQFAGYYVALDKGWYKAAGLTVKLNPSGPDLKPVSTVAAGSDHFGIGHPSQIIAARHSEVPLVMLTHTFQDSPLRYVAKQKSGIRQFSDIRGKKIGLWLGGDEFEFMAMLKKADIKPEELQIVPQGFEVTPFLEDRVDVLEVTIFNELNVIQQQGTPLSELTIFSAKDFGVALIQGGLFTTEKMIKEKPKVVQAVVTQTLRGWKYALEHPAETIDIILKYNSELKRDAQIAQLKALAKLIWTGPTLNKQLGRIDYRDLVKTQTILLESEQITTEQDLNQAYTLQFWKKVPEKYKTVHPDKAWLDLK